MKQALYILTGWLMMTSLTLSSCQDQSSARIAKEGNNVRGTGAKKDAQLVAELAAGNYAEIAMANTAIEKSENKEVKDLAALLKEDHTMWVNQLLEYAAKHNISITHIAPEKAAEDTRKLAEKNPPDEFDKKWCSQMLDKHEQSISKMEAAVNDASNPDLKAWLNTTLPKIRKDRDKLIECNNSLK
jgi:putative membrane protein